MTLGRFEYLLKQVNPRLRVRQRRYGDVGGIFVGMSGKGGYIARITKGELTMNGYRQKIVSPTNKMDMIDKGIIKKRGRKTLINLLRNYRWIKNHKDRTMLAYGVERK